MVEDVKALAAQAQRHALAQAKLTFKEDEKS